MDDRELDLLADLIARELLDAKSERKNGRRRRAAAQRKPRLLGPAPVWNQPLGAIAPPPDNQLAARDAAARRGIVEVAPRTPRRVRPRAVDLQMRELPIGVAARYVLLSETDWRALFGEARPKVQKPLLQPGQVAYEQTVRVVGPAGELERVRVLGPLRERSRVGLSRSDARRLGVAAPVRLPGDFSGAPSATLVGPSGSCTAAVVIAASHIHLSPDRASALSLRAGDRVSVRCGADGRSVSFHDLPVYVGEAHRPELHLDADEANAAGVRTSDVALLTELPRSPASGAPQTGTARRPLLTERDVDALAARGEQLSPHSPYMVTPAARDRARFLGIWREQP